MKDKAEVKVEDTPELSRKRDLDAAREAAERIRSERVGDIGTINRKLPEPPDRPGWKRRYVLTENVASRLSEGYSFVSKDVMGVKAVPIGYGNIDVGDRFAIHAGRGTIDHAGNQQVLFLMEIPLEIAKELDYAKSGKQIRATEAALMAGNSGGHIKADHHAYIPKDVGISIGTKIT